MDWAKILDKFFVFIAALIPGSSVLLVAALHRPDLWRQFRDLGYLGYQTKIAISVLAAFAAGHTVNLIVSLVIGGVTGGLQTAVVEPQTPQWRKQNWRRLLAAYLGSAAPENVALVDDPQGFNDGLWQEWWELLDELLTRRIDPNEVIGLNIGFNFGVACFILLLSAFRTPVLRQWWVILPSLFWVFSAGVLARHLQRSATDPQSRYFKQMQYLQTRVCRGERADDKA